MCGCTPLLSTPGPDKLWRLHAFAGANYVPDVPFQSAHFGAECRKDFCVFLYTLLDVYGLDGLHIYNRPRYPCQIEPSIFVSVVCTRLCNLSNHFQSLVRFFLPPKLLLFHTASHVIRNHRLPRDNQKCAPGDQVSGFDIGGAFDVRRSIARHNPHGPQSLLPTQRVSESRKLCWEM